MHPCFATTTTKKLHYTTCLLVPVLITLNQLGKSTKHSWHYETTTSVRRVKQLLTSGYSLTGTNSFSCRWTMGPIGSGSSRGCLSTRPFTVSLYMSLRTLLISKKHKHVHCGEQLNQQYNQTFTLLCIWYITVILILTSGQRLNVAYKSLSEKRKTTEICQLPRALFVIYRQLRKFVFWEYEKKRSSLVSVNIWRLSKAAAYYLKEIAHFENKLFWIKAENV